MSNQDSLHPVLVFAISAIAGFLAVRFLAALHDWRILPVLAFWALCLYALAKAK